MRNVLVGMLLALALIAAAGAWVWYYQPEHLPKEWRHENPRSHDYTPAVYRWKDAHGRVQLTDAPPTDRPYETIRIDPNRNVVPSLLPADDNTN